MNYFIRTFGKWTNISTKFHQISFKKYWKLSRSELGFGDPLEKVSSPSIQVFKYFLLVGEYSSWLNEGFKKKIKREFLAELYAKQYDFR